jgi:sec-independent protein translocase protein TatA
LNKDDPSDPFVSRFMSSGWFWNPRRLDIRRRRTPTTTTTSSPRPASLRSIYPLLDTMKSFLLALLCLVVGSSQAFVPAAPRGTAWTTTSTADLRPVALQRQRQSVAPIQTQGLFGLGAPEIGVILVAAAFLLGPEKLAEFGRDAGKVAGELKEVPKEFQKGLEEGEAQAKTMKATNAAVEAETVEEAAAKKD